MTYEYYEPWIRLMKSTLPPQPSVFSISSRVSKLDESVRRGTSGHEAQSPCIYNVTARSHIRRDSMIRGRSGLLDPVDVQHSYHDVSRIPEVHDD